MAVNWIKTSSGSTRSNQLFLFPEFGVGTWPTLLDATEAIKVKQFIEGIALRSQFKITTGNVQKGDFEIRWGSSGPTWEISVPTALKTDEDPYLGYHLHLAGFNVIGNRSGSIFKMSPEGLQISEHGGGAGKLVLLEGGSSSGGVGQGFKAASGGESIVWSIMPEDGEDGQFIKTNGAGALSFADAGFTDLLLEAIGTGVVTGDTTIVVGDDLTLKIADGLKAVGNNTDDFITLSINSEPCTFISLIDDGGGTVAGDTTVEIYENALTLDAGDNITLTGTTATGEVRITGTAAGATEIYLTAKGNGVVSGSPVGQHEGHWDFFAGDGIELHKETTPYEGVEIKTQDVVLDADSGTGAYTLGDSSLTIEGAGNVSTEVSGSVITITGSGSSSGFWEASDDHQTVEIPLGSGAADGLLFSGDTFIHAHITATGGGSPSYIVHELSATGTPDENSFLRGDNTWSTVDGTDQTLDVDGDTGSASVDLDDQALTISGGNGVETTGDSAQTIEVAVDDTVGQYINGVGFGDVSANSLDLIEGDNVTITTGTGEITISADKYAIVSGREPDTYVALACVEMPETRFDDIVTIAVDGKGSLEYALDPTYVHVCEPGTIKPISYTCTEAAIAGLDVVDGILRINFSHVTPLPREITVKLSGIRAGRKAKRFVEFTEEEARKNAAFWNGWTG
jgi:hypothetical protein